MNPDVKILVGDCLESLRTLPEESVHCVVTSPPYWGLRDYGVDGQIGLESTLEEFISRLVGVFSEVRRVLRKDGTCWVNMGDGYSDKQMVGQPWRLAFALQQPHRQWQIKDEAMRAWVGGIVDGEGCITILETKSSHSESLSYPPIIQVRMCDIEPLDRLVQVVGSSYGNPQHPPSQIAANQRQSWQWKVVSEQAAKVISEIYPFLTCKRKQAIVAWNHQAFRFARGNQSRAHGDIEKEQFCKTLINRLNQRENVDIPSWMKEPYAALTPGWYLRQDLIWHKPNPMPESIRDRCTKAHEYLFLLAKSEKYFWDFDAMKEPVSGNAHARGGGVNAKIKQPDGWASHKGAHGTIHKDGREKGTVRPKQNASFSVAVSDLVDSRNRRSVWTIPSEPCSDAHFATFPTALVRPCILAGCPSGGTVLDPFGGSGTTGVVALELSRSAILCELNPEYVEIARRRIASVTLGLPL